MSISIIYIAITLVLLLAIFCTIGFSIQRLFGINDYNIESIFLAFWVGFCLTLVFLQFWHLFGPVDIKPFVAVSSLSIISLIINKQSILEFFKTKFRLSFLVCLGLLSILIASQSIGPIIVNDSGVYHIPSIRWISSYQIIPGLCNLNNRLLISSYFLFLSLLDIGYWSHKSHHLANALLFLAISSQIIISTSKVIFDPIKVKIYDVMNVIMILPIVILCRLYASSPTPDIPLFILGVVVGGQLCKLLFNDNRQSIFFEVFLIIIVAAVGFTIKLNFAVIGICSSTIAIAKLSSHGEDLKVLIARIIAIYLMLPLGLIIIPFMTRNVILSGYPLYPSAYFPVGVEWKIPEQEIMTQWSYLKTHTRGLPGHQPDEIIAQWRWFTPWLKELFYDRYSLIMLMFPIFLAVTGLFILMFNYQHINKPVSNVLFAIPPIASIIFWIFTAPGVSYAGASFWILGAGTLAISYQVFNSDNFRKMASITLIGLIIISLIAVAMCRGTLRKNIALIPDEEGFYPIPKVEVELFTTKSGLSVFISRNGNKSWGAPIPCLPNPLPNLRLREEGNILKGFILSNQK
jgi:hypothetical protein